MSGLGFRFAPAIDHAQSGYGACVVVGVANASAKAGIPHFPIQEYLDDLPLLLLLRCIDQREGVGIDMPGIGSAGMGAMEQRQYH